MNLTLYKTPFVDPISPDRIRLLFEGSLKESPWGDTDDIYLYTWLTKEGLLDGFQVVCGETIAVTWQKKAGISWGTVSSLVINRGITEMQTAHDHSLCKHFIAEMDNVDFPLLLDAVKNIVSGKKLLSFKLGRTEMKLFRRIYGVV